MPKTLPRHLRKTVRYLIPEGALEGPFYRLLGCGIDYGAGRWPAMSFFEDASGVYGGWIYVLSGAIYYQIDGQRHKVSAGQALVNHRPEPGHLIRPALNEPLHLVWVNIGGAPGMMIFDHLRMKYGQIQDLPKDSAAVRLAMRLVRLAHARVDRPEHFWSVRTFEWLDAWWQAAEQSHQPTDRSILVTRPSRVVGVPRTVKEFAAKLGYSRAYLTRKLSRRWNDTPARVLRRLRLEEAARLLRNGRLSLREIASRSGYSSPISFSKAFRDKYGQAPGAYRHANR